MIGAGSIPVIGSRSPRVLPDAYPVDEHNRRKGTPAGITGARPTHRKIEDRKHQVVGLVERPHPLDGDRRNSEVGLRAVYVVAPEAEPASSHRHRQLCHSESTNSGIDFPDHVFPSDRAWTVVPGGHAPLPYHSTTSTSPSGRGSSFNNQYAGQQPLTASSERR